MSTHEFVPCYGAVPFRALRDRRLDGIPLALLGIIAAHDRFGRNGQGCWASHSRLAELLGCRREAVCKALALLEALGYIGTSVDESDRRRRSYRVIYNEVDAEAFAARERGTSHRRDHGKKCAPERTDRREECVRPSAQTQAAICAPERTDLLAEKPPESPVNTGSPDAQSQGEYIPQSGKISSKSARSPQGDWGCGARSGHGGEWWRKVGPERTEGLIRDTLHGMGENRHRPRVATHA
jgi:DNA-binding MarR family transcriptional regulator